MLQIAQQSMQSLMLTMRLNGVDVGTSFPHPYYNSIGTSEPYSFHTGGINACMGDGSVQWISADINIRDFARMVTRAGTEINATN